MGGGRGCTVGRGDAEAGGVRGCDAARPDVGGESAVGEARFWVGERGGEVVVDREKREEDSCCHGGGGGRCGGEGATGMGRVIYRGVERSTPWVGDQIG